MVFSSSSLLRIYAPQSLVILLASAKAVAVLPCSFPHMSREKSSIFYYESPGRRLCGLRACTRGRIDIGRQAGMSMQATRPEYEYQRRLRERSEAICFHPWWRAIKYRMPVYSASSPTQTKRETTNKT